MHEYNLCVVVSGVKLAVREPGDRNTARRSYHYSDKMYHLYLSERMSYSGAYNRSGEEKFT